MTISGTVSRNKQLGLKFDLRQFREVVLTNASADFNQSGWTIEQALDRNEKTAWGIHPKTAEPHYAVFELKQPLSLSNNATLMFVLKQLHGEGHLIGRPRLLVTDAHPPARVGVLPSEIARILAVPTPERSDVQRKDIAQFVLKEKIARELASLPKPSLIMLPPASSIRPVSVPPLIVVEPDAEPRADAFVMCSAPKFTFVAPV